MIIFLAHIVSANIFPYPLNHLNIIFVSLLLMMVFGNRRVIWYALFISFLSELFVSTPFGINTAALMITLIGLNWVLLNLFTNRTVFIVILTSLFSLLIYRVIYVAILAVVYFFTDLSAFYITSAMAYDFGVEIVVNTVISILTYLLLSIFIRRRKPITLSQDKHYVKGYF